MIVRKTSAKASHYGADSDRPLVVTLIPAPAGEDIVVLHPLRCPSRRYAITVRDLWSFLQKCEANKSKREKDAIRKTKRAEAKERARLQRSVRSNSPKEMHGGNRTIYPPSA